MSKNIILSRLGHTWIIDLDGTIVFHNGYLEDEGDRFLEGAKEFLASIPLKDMIIFLTSRKEEYRKITEHFLKENGVRYECIVFGAPYGERILVNDDKPSGLKTSLNVNVIRNQRFDLTFSEDANL